MSSQLSCSISVDKDCNKTCVENFYKTPCPDPCKNHIIYKDKPLDCSVDGVCEIKLERSWELYPDYDNICNEGSSSCGGGTLFQLKIWMDQESTQCDSPTATTARCNCTECFKRRRTSWTTKCLFNNIYCSCEDKTSSISTTPIDIGSSAKSEGKVITTSAIPPTPLAVSSDKSGVTGAATGGAVGLLLIVLLILFALWFRRRRIKKSKDRHISTPPSMNNMMYDAHNGSFVLPPDENGTVPRDNDYANLETTQGASCRKIAGENQTNDYDMANPEPEENYFILDPSEVPPHERKATKEQSDDVYENSYGPPHLKRGQIGSSNTISEGAEYNTLNQEGSHQTLNDDQYQHVKNIQNSNGQDDYDALAKPFDKQKNYPNQDDYDHCKIPSRRDDDNDGDDYDHLK